MAYKIAIANQKGGVGKSTSTAELAAILSTVHNKKVLVIDFDQQCNLSSNLGAYYSYPTIHDLFTLENPNVNKAIQHLAFGFDMISGSSSLSKADTEFSDAPDMYLLNDLMEVLDDKYDFIIVDNGPARNKLLNMSYLSADFFIMCIDSSENSIDGIDAIVEDMMKYHKKGKKSLSKAKIIGVIVSRYRNTSIGNTIIEVMEQKIDDYPDIIKTKERPFVMKVREAAVVDEAKIFRKTVQEYKRFSNPAVDYRNIVRSLLSHIEKEGL